MSQSAASRALSRIRIMFDDPILVRTPNGYDLSARAESLAPQIDQLLAQANQLIHEPAFDVATSTQSVKFFAMEPELVEFIPPLFEKIREQAPNMCLEAQSTPKDHFEALESGEVHFVISTFTPSVNTNQLRSLKLNKLDLVFIMSRDNELASEELTAEDVINAQHGYISLTGKGESLLEQNMRKQGLLSPEKSLNTPIKLSGFNTIGPVCESTDIIFCLPRKVSEETMKGRNILIKESPPELDQLLSDIHLYWHERHHKDPMCQWIREQIKNELLAT